MKMRALTISELNGYLSKVVKADSILQSINVEGEISNLKFHSSGNIYFALKDDRSKINCIAFENILDLKTDFSEGDKVICKGKINFYERDAGVSLIISSIEKKGMGELYRKFLELKDNLSKEGLFDEKNKKKLPSMPSKIGVISSPTGSVIKDIYNVIKNRFPKVEIVLYPSAVQGDLAHQEIMAGIRYFNKEKKADRADVLILARGGGSYEELIAFNNELLAYEIFKSKIPVISAVGHETDFTIADFVADYRASTPSMAAEVAVPNLKNTLLELEARFNILNLEMKSKVDVYSQNLVNLRNLLESYNPSNSLKLKMDELHKCKNELEKLMNSKLENNDLLLNYKREQLILLNPLKLLERGYAVIYKEDEAPAYRASNLAQDEIISIKFFDGTVSAKVIGEKNEIKI